MKAPHLTSILVGFFYITITGVVLTEACSISDEQLFEDRKAKSIAIAEGTNLACGDYFDLSNETFDQLSVWSNVGVGKFATKKSIDEYFSIVLAPGGGCQNAFGYQLTKLVDEAYPESFEQVDTDKYTMHYKVDAYFTQLFPFDGSNWAAITRGHHFIGTYTYKPCSTIIDYLVTEDLGGEVVQVGNDYNPSQTPSEVCGLMAYTQSVFYQREGFYPSNITGYNFLDPLGFVECIAYVNATMHTTGCGTPLVDHKFNCWVRHMITYLTEGASPVHAHHWARLDYNPTKCLDSCLPVTATCQPNADPVPGNRVKEDGTFEYFCKCKEGYKGDGVTSPCVPVNCTKDSNCKPHNAAYCDIETGLCMAKDTFEWDSLQGKGLCPEGFKTWYNTTTNRHDCIRNDKCWSNRECLQPPPRVRCTYPGNLASPFGICTCNPGFLGDFDLDCACPTEKNMTDAAPQFKVCLAQGECSLDSHCKEGETCSSSQYDVIGTCQ